MTVQITPTWKPFKPLSMLRAFGGGVRIAILSDRNVATQLALSLVVLGITFWQRQWFDFALILAVTGYMVVVELVNTAIEAICDYIQPDFDPRIGAIKDVAAAASGIAILIWLGTMIYEAVRLWSLFQ